VGLTYSSDFPITGGFDTTLGGLGDAFLTKVNADGSSLVWSSYLARRGGQPFQGDLFRLDDAARSRAVETCVCVT